MDYSYLYTLPFTEKTVHFQSSSWTMSSLIMPLLGGGANNSSRASVTVWNHEKAFWLPFWTMSTFWTNEQMFSFEFHMIYNDSLLQFLCVMQSWSSASLQEMQTIPAWYTSKDYCLNWLPSSGPPEPCSYPRVSSTPVYSGYPVAALYSTVAVYSITSTTRWWWLLLF